MFRFGRITATLLSRLGDDHVVLQGVNLHQLHPHDLSNLLV